ncbi:MAG: LLM class F420-dependent oxidoreductase [Streptosporangiales bacterium]|nr:LLM class F420-dependent oxidoreductase [Streptosporangiales bacterium]
MRLALNLGYWGAENDSADGLRLVTEAERLGFACAWAAEAYGSDAVSVLSWLAAQTQRIELGAAVLQIPARSPAMTAMTAASLDALSGGRFRLGLGVSGPQVSEGWHGVRFADPLGRTREYVDIVQLALERKHRVKYDGTHFQLPLPDGPGKALRMIVHPVRESIPVYLAALGPKNLELTGEIADGWLGMFVAARQLGETLSTIESGRTKAGKSLAGFDVQASVPIAVGDDPAACADFVRPHTALYVGGMGSRKQNFYRQAAERLGYEDAAAEVQERFLGRDYEGAGAALPFELLDETALLGDEARIADRMQAYAAAGVTTLSLGTTGATVDERLASLRTAAAALDRAGVGD